MLVIFTILVILAIICLVLARLQEEWIIGTIGLGFIAFMALLMSLNYSTTAEHLSGYIYSSETNWTGYTRAHIRFSQNAGQDVQPSFCVKADSEPGQAIAKYTGTDTKVKIEIPRYFYLSNNPWACGTTAMTIIEAK